MTPTPDRTPDCDHKFVDSNRCLKCGWTPRDPASPAPPETEER